MLDNQEVGEKKLEFACQIPPQLGGINNAQQLLKLNEFNGLVWCAQGESNPCSRRERAMS